MVIHDDHWNEYSNYIAYRDSQALDQPRIGHLNIEEGTIVPLSHTSGTPLRSLYEVIQVGEVAIQTAGEAFPLSSVTVLPPISGRDVLCVGKNYSEHAKEFNSSGYDSSDKVDIPTHPVIFTKRSTSIIATGEEILLLKEFTKSADYEGEIGVIIKQAGYRIDERDAMKYVWGYTIVNDVTARERQRDHKQFYIGKSPDTFCPMGPIAVPAHRLPKVLRVKTFVNGQERQNATTEDLIFSIPFLIKTLSAGQTLQPGDVLATGTPAGVGIGKTPPVFLKPGDVIEVSVTGLSTLKNKVSETDGRNPTGERVESESRSHIPITNFDKTLGGIGLTSVKWKKLYYKNSGNPSGPPLIFIHGLGGSSDAFQPLISSLKLAESHSLHLIDLEGHGLSPTAADSIACIEQYVEDVLALVSRARIPSGATIVAHSMGCLVALKLAIENPSLISKLVLLGPPPSPIPEARQKAFIERASIVRKKGMISSIDALLSVSISETTKNKNPIAALVVRLSLMGMNPEAYAKGCTALAGHTEGFDLRKVFAQTLIITGDQDVASSPDVCMEYVRGLKGSQLKILKDVGHWHLFEDHEGVVDTVKPFLLG